MSLIAFYPKTGRTHQLRVHALHHFGVAILGDTLYSPEGAPTAERLFLHAFRMKFPLYPNKTPVEVHAPVPDEFKALAVVAKCPSDDLSLPE